MGNGVLGVGGFLPSEVRDNTWWPHFSDVSQKRTDPGDFLDGRQLDLSALPRAKRIQKEEMAKFAGDPYRSARLRRVAPLSMSSVDMEAAASREAIQTAGLRPEDVDLIVVNSCPSDDYLPNNATALQAVLGIGPSMALAVDTACTSFLSGMSVADALIHAGRAKVALVVVSSQMSRLNDPNDRTAVMHGDGAGAVVIGRVPQPYGFLQHIQRGEGDYHGALCCGPKDGSRWYEGNGRLCGFARDVEAAKEYLDEMTTRAVEAIETLLSRSGLTRADLHCFLPHQGSQWTNRACLRACDLEHCETVNTFREYANMGAPNYAINLWTLVREGRIRPGETVAFFALGMGVNWAATLLRWGKGGE